MKIFNAILGLYAILNSLYCIFWPEESVFGIGLIIAILLALWGIASIAEYFISRKSIKGLKTGGSVGLAFGIIALIVSLLSLSSVILAVIATVIIILCLALGFAVKGVIELASKSNGKKSAWTVIAAVLYLLSGIFGVVSVIFMPERSSLAVGIMLLIIGVAEISSLFGDDAAQEQSEIW